MLLWQRRWRTFLKKKDFGCTHGPHIAWVCWLNHTCLWIISTLHLKEILLPSKPETEIMSGMNAVVSPNSGYCFVSEKYTCYRRWTSWDPSFEKKESGLGRFRGGGECSRARNDRRAFCALISYSPKRERYCWYDEYETCMLEIKVTWIMAVDAYLGWQMREGPVKCIYPAQSTPVSCWWTQSPVGSSHQALTAKMA